VCELALILLLALAVRGFVLAYNVQVNGDSVWTWQARAALHGAKLLTGDARPTPAIDDVAADFMFVYGVGGQTYLHLAWMACCGTSSYLHMQVLQLSVDTLLTLPIILIGWVLGGRKVGLLAGLGYAVFWPQVWLAVVPAYDFWASAGFIAATAQFLWGMRCQEDRQRAWLVWFCCGALTAALAACIRPTVLLYPAAWVGLWCLVARCTWLARCGGVAAVACGLFLGHLPVLVHGYYVFGAGVRPPGNAIHQFWCGVGQYPNPYGVADHDGSVCQFYERLTGRKGPDYQFSDDYVAVLKREATTYLQTYPGHYVSCVARRGALLVSGIGLRQARLDADVWRAQGDIVARREERGELVRQYGTVRGLLWYALRHPDMYASYPLLLLPCLGVCAAFVWQRRALVWLASMPLLYSVALFAPYYYCERCVISAYAAVVPVWVLGLVVLWEQARRLCQWLAGRHRVEPPVAVLARPSAARCA